ncbi:hypothetical protein [Streptomyces rubrolavendulae]|uniref:Uncharacterized protein n=1 Tax=Streptomyces rubrolavendulae TaxID=285473 RepID=A0A1D8G2Q5_9ACTN|nr:hypothetical protein [Streptomyces rubrolavendulae]AOT59715.1 hypothetical protein A4G23_02558 [Streptomyces rubrolavendulae]
MKLRVKYVPPEALDRSALQGTTALRERKEYVVLELFSQSDGNTLFRVEYNESEDSALFDSRAFTITSHNLPPTWRYFQHSSGSFSLCPEPWSQPGFWEAYYERESHARKVYEAEKQKIVKST